MQWLTSLTTGASAVPAAVMAGAASTAGAGPAASSSLTSPSCSSSAASSATNAFCPGTNARSVARMSLRAAATSWTAWPVRSWPSCLRWGVAVAVGTGGLPQGLQGGGDVVGGLEAVVEAGDLEHLAGVLAGGGELESSGAVVAAVLEPEEGLEGLGIDEG